MLGRELEILGTVEVSADGNEAEPCSILFRFPISVLVRYFGSPEYSSPTLNNTLQTVSKSVINNIGT